MRLARFALSAVLALAPPLAIAGQRSIGNNSVPASNAQEVICVDPVTGLPTGCGGSGGGGGGAINAPASSYAPGAFQVGAGLAGWDVTEGTPTDAAWTSGAGSVVAVLKAIVAAANASPVPLAATTTDASGTITTGGSWQTVLASSATRRGCLIQNAASATTTLYVHADASTPSVNNSVALSPGAPFSCNPPGIVITDQIQVMASDTAHVFIAKGQ